jgi:hypothetical protein
MTDFSRLWIDGVFCIILLALIVGNLAGNAGEILWKFNDFHRSQGTYLEVVLR